MVDNVHTLAHTQDRRYRWDQKKDEFLRDQGRPGFESIVEAIENGGVIDDISHPSPSYTEQRMLIVRIGGYVHYVPYRLEGSGEFFLITVIPSRKLQKRYGEKP